MMVLAALMLAGCHDYEETSDVNQKDILSCFDANGKAWLNLQIPLGFQTRSEFNDGDPSEYAVHSLTIVLFHGSSEADARVASSYLFTFTEQMDPATQVTKTLQVSSDNIQKDDNIYLLAILNANPPLASGTPFSVVSDMLTDVTNTYNNTNYFVMTNASLATANDGTGEVKTLVYMNPSFFYATEEEALAHPASHIYVERVGAKVTVERGNIPTITNGTYTDYYVKGNPNLVFTNEHLADYTIYNYNAQSYLVRHFDANWLPLSIDNNVFRFVEPQALPYGTPSMYRTYWAQDVNYSTGMTNNTEKGWKTIGSSDYCAENTMDLAHMDIKNSTLALVKLNLNNYWSFYTTSVTGTDVIYQLPVNYQEEEGTSAHDSFAPSLAPRMATDDSHYYVSSARPIDEYLREWLMQTNSDARDWVNTYAAGDASRIIIDLEASDGTKAGPHGGGLAVVKCSQKARTSGTVGANAFDALGLNAYFASNITVNYYHHGYCYYLVPIMHFGDSQTPWQSAPSMTGSTAAAAYGSNNAAYLGRYGVVRNNWYNISITGVSHVGYCNAALLFDKMKDQADDTVEQLLNATLVISPWTANNNVLTPNP